jgi:hypothetical protein
VATALKEMSDGARNARAFLYIVAATERPDQVTCRVPWEVNEHEVFFGPCKKRLREELRQLLGTRDSMAPAAPIWLIGFSPSNSRPDRRVLWAGRITRLMTFGEAYARLEGAAYARMRADEQSPLHVKPIIAKNQLIGYEHRSQLHAKRDAWVLDLVKNRESKAIRVQGRQLVIQNGFQRAEALPRDICASCDNLFFARGREGLIVDGDLVAILQRAQSSTKIGRYAIFGRRRDGSANGKTGGYLEVHGCLVDDIVAWITERAPKASKTTLDRHATVRC